MVDERISRAIDNDHTAAMKVTSDGRKISRKKNGTLFATSNGLFICTFCKKVFKSHYLFRKHLKNHSDKTYVCHICSKGFVHRHYLVNHMSVHNIGEMTEYQCHLCSKRFTQKGNLNQHLKFHANKKPFKCDTCGKDFYQQEHLRAHLRHHNNERPFKCEVCNKAFNIKSSLQRHMNCHTGVKPFICDTCQRGYTRRSVLMLHIQQVHENRKPYQCSECLTCFSQKGNLQAHFRRKHLQPKIDGKRDSQRDKVRRTIRKQAFKQNTKKLSPLKIVPIADIYTHSQLTRPSTVDFISVNGESLKWDVRLYENSKVLQEVVTDSDEAVVYENTEEDNSAADSEDASHPVDEVNVSTIEDGELYRFLSNNNEFFYNSSGSSSSQDTANSEQSEQLPLGIPDDLKGMCEFDLSSDLKDWEEFFLSDSDILNDYDVDLMSSPSKSNPLPVKTEPVEEQFSRHPISLCHDYASPLPIVDSPENSSDPIPSNCSRTLPMKKNNHPNQVRKKLKDGLDVAENCSMDLKPIEFTLYMERKIPCMT